MSKRGLTNVDCLDASAEMLAEAKKRNVYRNLIEAFLGKNRLPIDSGEQNDNRNTENMISGSGKLIS